MRDTMKTKIFLILIMVLLPFTAIAAPADQQLLNKVTTCIVAFHELKLSIQSSVFLTELSGENTRKLVNGYDVIEKDSRKFAALANFLSNRIQDGMDPAQKQAWMQAEKSMMVNLIAKVAIARYRSGDAYAFTQATFEKTATCVANLPDWEQQIAD